MLQNLTRVGVGRSCEVFTWEQGNVLKLLLKEVPQDWADIEARCGRDAQTAGLPVPRFGEVTEIEGRRGFIIEYIHGKSMLELLGKQPWRVWSLARTLATLQAQVHACPAPASWVEQIGWLREDIEPSEILAGTTKEKVLALLGKLPTGSQMCHGDFHPGNIILTSRGPVIIDWLAGTRGNPMSDMARTAMILSTGQPPPGTPGRWLIELIRKTLLGIYQQTYFKLCPQGGEEFLAWRAVNAAAFLKHSLPEEQPVLLEMIHQAIQ